MKNGHDTNKHMLIPINFWKKCHNSNIITSVDVGHNTYRTSGHAFHQKCGCNKRLTCIACSTPCCICVVKILIIYWMKWIKNQKMRQMGFGSRLLCWKCMMPTRTPECPLLKEDSFSDFKNVILTQKNYVKAPSGS